jgi:5-methyltetrahydrofolate--homocysteine methyltransferase
VTIVNEGLEQELKWVTRPDENARIRGLFEGVDPLMQDMAYHLVIADQHAVDRMTVEALERGSSANEILDQGLISGMAIVGVKFRDNVIFVPEVLVAARAMKAGMNHLEPILSASDVEPLGTVIMGTVKGDLHDVGKNLCTMLLRGAGFVVHDLGVDTKSEEFIEAVREHDAQIVGMSALLTTTMDYIETTVRKFQQAGLRDNVKIMAGGAALTEQLAREMKADGYGKDALGCVEEAKQLLGLGDTVSARPDRVADQSRPQ